MRLREYLIKQMLRTLSTCVDRILQENIGYPFESAELCKKLNETIIVRRIVSQIAAIVRESATVLPLSVGSILLEDVSG